jgi:hypothetical protein
VLQHGVGRVEELLRLGAQALDQQWQAKFEALEQAELMQSAIRVNQQATVALDTMATEQVGGGGRSRFNAAVLTGGHACDARSGLSKMRRSAAGSRRSTAPNCYSWSKRGRRRWSGSALVAPRRWRR